MNSKDTSCAYKSELERILTHELRKHQRKIRDVAVTENGEFAVYNIADRYTVRRLSDLGKEFLRTGDMKSASPEDFLVRTPVPLQRTQTGSRRLQFPYRCRDCGGQVGMRSRRRRWMERYILSVLFLKPVRCASCFRRDYWPISTPVYQRDEAAIQITRHLWGKAA